MTRTTTTKKTVESILTENVIKKMEETQLVPWKQPWKENLAISFSSKKPFNLVNTFLLEHGGEYITFNKLKGNGWTLKDNAKSEKVYQKFIKTYTLTDKDGNEVKDEDGNIKTRNYFYMKYTNEFPIAYCQDKNGNDIVPSKQKELQNYNCERLIDNYFNHNPHIKLDNDSNFNEAYHRGNASGGVVCVPNIEKFNSVNEYYSTLFHEMTHSTKYIMKRECSKSFGDEKYSFEELVAECGAWILRGITGIDNEQTQQNSATYLNAWKQKLQDNPQWIYNAMANAQKAVEYILEGYEEPTEEKHEEKEVKQTSFDSANQRKGYNALAKACMKARREVLHGFNKQKVNDTEYNVMTDSYHLMLTEKDLSEVTTEVKDGYPNVERLIPTITDDYKKVSVNELDIAEIRKHAKYSPTGKHEADAIVNLIDNVYVCAKYFTTIIECMDYKYDNVTFYYNPNELRPLVFKNNTNDIGILLPVRKL